jgi:hypothetical protein
LYRAAFQQRKFPSLLTGKTFLSFAIIVTNGVSILQVDLLIELLGTSVGALKQNVEKDVQELRPSGFA